MQSRATSRATARHNALGKGLLEQVQQHEEVLNQARRERLLLPADPLKALHMKHAPGIKLQFLAMLETFAVESITNTSGAGAGAGAGAAADASVGADTISKRLNQSVSRSIAGAGAGSSLFGAMGGVRGGSESPTRVAKSSPRGNPYINHSHMSLSPARIAIGASRGGAAAAAIASTNTNASRNSAGSSSPSPARRLDKPKLTNAINPSVAAALNQLTATNSPYLFQHQRAIIERNFGQLRAVMQALLECGEWEVLSKLCRTAVTECKLDEQKLTELVNFKNTVASGYDVEPALQASFGGVNCTLADAKVALRRSSALSRETESTQATVKHLLVHTGSARLYPLYYAVRFLGHPLWETRSDGSIETPSSKSNVYSSSGDNYDPEIDLRAFYAATDLAKSGLALVGVTFENSTSTASASTDAAGDTTADKSTTSQRARFAADVQSTWLMFRYDCSAYALSAESYKQWAHDVTEFVKPKAVSTTGASAGSAAADLMNKYSSSSSSSKAQARTAAAAGTEARAAAAAQNASANAHLRSAGKRRVHQYDAHGALVADNNGDGDSRRDEIHYWPPVPTPSASIISLQMQLALAFPHYSLLPSTTLFQPAEMQWCDGTSTSPRVMQVFPAYPAPLCQLPQVQVDGMSCVCNVIRVARVACAYGLPPSRPLLTVTPTHPDALIP